MSRNPIAQVLPSRTQSVGEEIANAVSHGVGLLLAVIAALVLVVAAVQRSEVDELVGASIFGTTMVLMYLTSTLYHALPMNLDSAVKISWYKTGKK